MNRNKVTDATPGPRQHFGVLGPNSNGNANQINTGASRFGGNSNGRNMMGMMLPFLSGGFGGTNPDPSNPFVTSLQWLQYLNYIVYSLGNIIDMIGMNANAIVNAYHVASGFMQNLIKIIKQSDFRKWMLQKSKKSKVVRYLFVFLSMLATHLTFRLIRFLYYYFEFHHGPPSHTP
jgi:hypothetical protein